MNQEIEQYLGKYPQEITDLFLNIRTVIVALPAEDIEEKMWAKLPSYCRGEKFVRLIPFRDHINIEAAGLLKLRDAFDGCRFTPKGMLQLTPKQKDFEGLLKTAFMDTFGL